MNRDHKQLPEWLGDSPVLLYGARKAGTTLLQNLCDGGDELFVYSTELKLKKLNKVLWASDFASAVQQYEDECIIEDAPSLDLARYKEQMSGLKDKEITCLGELIQHHIHAVFCAVDGLPTSINRWAVKEVGGDTDAVIRQWKHMYLSGKIVMTLRNPMMTVRSVIRQRRSVGIRTSSTSIYRQVRDPYQVMTAISRLFGNKSIHIVCYEDMTSDTEKVMRSICDYIGMSYHEKMSQPTLFGNNVVVNTSSKATNKVFNTDISWKNDLSPREVLCVLASIVILRVRNIFVRTRNKINFTRYQGIVGQMRNRSSVTD